MGTIILQKLVNSVDVVEANHALYTHNVILVIYAHNNYKKHVYPDNVPSTIVGLPI